MAANDMLCAFRDGTCSYDCMAYDELEDGTPTCLRLEPVEVKFRNWLYVHNGKGETPEKKRGAVRRGYR